MPESSARRPGGPALPLILCYHKIERRRELGVTRLSPRRFARQIERFADAGWRTLTVAELLACVSGVRAAGPREFALTFDDAYRGLRDFAFPVLRAHAFTGICAVITDYAGRLNRWDVAYGTRRFAHLSWRDMRRWRDRGVEFISHTATHPRLPWLGDNEVRRELARSRHALEHGLGRSAAGTVVSYPFGAAGGRECAIARDEGYDMGFVLSGRWRGSAMRTTRLPVYPWSPRLPGSGPLAPLERLAAAAANRCAVGTTLWQSLTARN